MFSLAPSCFSAPTEHLEKVYDITYFKPHYKYDTFYRLLLHSYCTAF